MAHFAQHVAQVWAAGQDRVTRQSVQGCPLVIYKCKKGFRLCFFHMCLIRNFRWLLPELFEHFRFIFRLHTQLRLILFKGVKQLQITSRQNERVTDLVDGE